ncbi:MAG: hypothetical protein KKH68_08975, partial [Proteobacteria bacterium]|nr:hypothetical protein [Pseudomonadota bacterium]
KDLLIHELLQGLDLSGKHESQLILLREICGIDITGIESVRNDYQDAIRSISQERMDVIKHTLAQKRFISGTAVVPNFEADKVWMAKILEIKNQFDQLLDQKKAAVK